MMAVRDNEHNWNSPFLLIGAVDQKKNISSVTLFQVAKICKYCLIKPWFQKIMFSRQGVNKEFQRVNFLCSPKSL